MEHAPGRGVGVRAAARSSPGALSDPLFLRLKALRRRLADAQGVPAYIVFSDAVLVQMVQKRPTTSDQLLQVSGVGPVKLARYGADFLKLLNASARSVID